MNTMYKTIVPIHSKEELSCYLNDYFAKDSKPKYFETYFLIKRSNGLVEAVSFKKKEGDDYYYCSKLGYCHGDNLDKDHLISYFNSIKEEDENVDEILTFHDTLVRNGKWYEIDELGQYMLSDYNFEILKDMDQGETLDYLISNKQEMA